MSESRLPEFRRRLAEEVYPVAVQAMGERDATRLIDDIEQDFEAILANADFCRAVASIGRAYQLGTRAEQLVRRLPEEHQRSVRQFPVDFVLETAMEAQELLRENCHLADAPRPLPRR